MSLPLRNPTLLGGDILLTDAAYSDLVCAPAAALILLQELTPKALPLVYASPAAALVAVLLQNGRLRLDYWFEAMDRRSATWVTVPKSTGPWVEVDESAGDWS